MKTVADAVEILRCSEKFRQWHPKPISANGLHNYVMAEKHYAPDELAELWAVSTETIRSIFRNEPGVLKIGNTGSRHRRGYITLRIPQDVAERVHKRLSA